MKLAGTEPDIPIIPVSKRRTVELAEKNKFRGMNGVDSDLLKIVKEQNATIVEGREVLPNINNTYENNEQSHSIYNSMTGQRRYIK